MSSHGPERVLGDHRLVTLVGAGGIGKTRLAEEIAAVESDDGEQVRWVDLTRAEHADGIDALLLDATGARGPQPPIWWASSLHRCRGPGPGCL